MTTLSKKQTKLLNDLLVKRSVSVMDYAAADIEELEAQKLIECVFWRDEYLDYEGMSIHITPKGAEIAKA
jgi:hypothetical protein